MELPLSEVARLLGETEDTIHRWAKEGGIPAHRVHEQYLFNRVELQEWATAHGRPLPPEVFGERLPSLRAACERGGVHYRVPGTTREEVLASVAELPGVPESVDRGLLRELLVARERLGTTGLGGGVAIPHTRDPFIARVEEPVLLLAFLAQPVDFHAVDGQPVRVLFALLSPTVQKHLQTLSRLAAALQDPTLQRLLETVAPPEAILGRLGELEGDRR